MDILLTADPSIFKAPTDVHCLSLARNRVPQHDRGRDQIEAAGAIRLRLKALDRR
ncbi:hypothetical protein AB4Y45_45665 [Paraburkholderia sp. EG287A]|uniref:hypothetical protein n=1 Tax=Paraburkholderia sp. EG287A TaxID=3237012 RepID=UPI0034D20C05